MAACVCASINLLIIALCLRDRKEFFYPVFLLNIMWLLVNVLNIILGWNTNEIEYLILALPPLMFSIGFKISEKCTFRARTNISQSSKAVRLLGLKKQTSNTIIFVIGIIFVFYAYFFLSRMHMYGGFNAWVALRRIIWDEDINENFVYRYMVVPAFLMPSVFLISAQKSKSKYDRLKFLIALVIAVVWSILRTSRTSTFYVIIIMVMSQISLMGENANADLRAWRKEKRKKRNIFVAAVAFIVFLFLYIALQKNTDTYGDVSRIEFYLKSLANYTNLSSAAFVEWYKRGFAYTNGTNTFRFVFALLQKLGIYTAAVASNSGGLFISYEGLSTNALTVAQSYVADYGVAFMGFMMMLFGIIHGAVYKRSKNSVGLKRIRFALINAMLDIPLFYQILTNQYMNVLSAWIQYTLWICLFTSPLLWRKSVEVNVE